jgi:Na+/proline symporter
MMAGRSQTKSENGTYEQYSEPLSKRIGRFVTLMGLVFAISGGVVVTQRLSEDTLALLLGLSCGIAAMLPTVLLGGLWLKRELGQRNVVQQTPAQAAMQPPVVVVTPQALPGYGQAPYAALSAPVSSQWQSVPTQREFKIVGGID